METFTLIAWLMVGERLEEHRTRGLSELDCQIWAAEVREPMQAMCVREGLPALAPGTKLSHLQLGRILLDRRGEADPPLVERIGLGTDLRTLRLPPDCNWI